MQYEGPIDTAWVEGTITVRAGESIQFVGRVTGVSLDDITLVFHASDRGTYRYAKGSLGSYAAPQRRRSS